MKRLLPNRPGRKILLCTLLIVFALLISLYQHWEPSEETYGYWLFARIFSETGKLPIISRSPLYIIYLNLFRFLSVPNAIILEYLVTTCLTVISLVMLFAADFGLITSSLLTISWIPFMQVSEPPVQKIALALICWSFIVRRGKSDRFRLVLSYALLIIAYFFRSTYLFYLLIFIVWDLGKYLLILKKPIKQLFKIYIRTDWPIFGSIILYIQFMVFQSASVWNNIYFSTSTWFPANGKGFSMIDGYNWSYILEHYGTYWGHDFYFTNQEVFHGATSVIGAIRANPEFVMVHFWNNIKLGAYLIANLTLISQLFSFTQIPQGADVITIVILIFAAIKSNRNKLIIPLVIGNIIMMLATFAYKPPDTRYLFPMILIYAYAALGFIRWFNLICLKSQLSVKSILIRSGIVIVLISAGYGTVTNHFNFQIFNWPTVAKIFSAFGIMMLIASIRPQFINSRIISGLRIIILSVITLGTIYLFSSGPDLYNGYDYVPINLTTTIQNWYRDYQSQDLRILQTRNIVESNSLTQTFSKVNQLIEKCHGVMTEEHPFIGAFANIPLSHVYDIWEIPPFDYLGESKYTGLYPDRINCILVSHDLINFPGAGTNARMRYDAYISPYIQKLQGLGAKTVDIANYGQLVIF